MQRATTALNRKARNLFLLSFTLAAAWFGINLVGPNLAAGRFPVRLGIMLLSTVIFLYGLSRALKRTEFSPTKRRSTWFVVASVLTLWIATAWVLAANGVFHRSIGQVPSLPIAILVPIALGMFVLTRSKTVASLLDATPPSWLIGLQMYRILGIVFVVYWIRGSMPGAFAFPAGVGDVAAGLLALSAAVWVATGSPAGRQIGIRWNIFGLTDFAVALTMGMLTSPGPLQLLARDHPNTMIATFPTAMVPAFIVPFSTLLHVLSLRQFARLQTTPAITKEKSLLVAV